MKTNEKIQPDTNKKVENSAQKRSPGRVLLGLGVILVGLLLTAVIIASNNSQIKVQFFYEQGTAEEKICDLISVQISDLVRTWEKTSVRIIVEEGGNGYTLTYGRIVLMLRSFQSGISSDEIIEVQENIIDRAMIDLGEPSYPIMTALDESCSGSMVVYGFAICDNWITTSYSKITNSNEGVTDIHQEALKWFKQQLISQYRN